jgi:hypothetical protein
MPDYDLRLDLIALAHHLLPPGWRASKRGNYYRNLRDGRRLVAYERRELWYWLVDDAGVARYSPRGWPTAGEAAEAAEAAARLDGGER